MLRLAAYVAAADAGCAMPDDDGALCCCCERCAVRAGDRALCCGPSRYSRAVSSITENLSDSAAIVGVSRGDCGADPDDTRDLGTDDDAVSSVRKSRVVVAPRLRVLTAAAGDGASAAGEVTTAGAVLANAGEVI